MDENTIPDKVVRDAQSLRRVGWSIHDVVMHLLKTQADYEVKLTYDSLTKLLTPKKPKPPALQRSFPDLSLSEYRVAKGWKDPKDKQKSNSELCERYITSLVQPGGELEDACGAELVEACRNAGFCPTAYKAAMHNLGRE